MAGVPRPSPRRASPSRPRRCEAPFIPGVSDRAPLPRPYYNVSVLPLLVSLLSFRWRLALTGLCGVHLLGVSCSSFPSASPALSGAQGIARGMRGRLFVLPPVVHLVARAATATPLGHGLKDSPTDAPPLPSASLPVQCLSARLFVVTSAPQTLPFALPRPATSGVGRRPVCRSFRSWVVATAHPGRGLG